MAKLEQMIAETQHWRAVHMEAYLAGQKGRTVDAAACAIRERALLDAKEAMLADTRQSGEGE